MKAKALLLAGVLSLTAAVAARAQGLPSARPEQVGLCSDSFQRITDTIKAGVDKQGIPGAVIFVYAGITRSAKQVPVPAASRIGNGCRRHWS
jgi:hypothetical protein